MIKEKDNLTLKSQKTENLVQDSPFPVLLHQIYQALNILGKSSNDKGSSYKSDLIPLVDLDLKKLILVLNIIYGGLKILISGVQTIFALFFFRSESTYSNFAMSLCGDLKSGKVPLGIHLS